MKKPMTEERYLKLKLKLAEWEYVAVKRQCWAEIKYTIIKCGCWVLIVYSLCELLKTLYGMK